ncbi:hypothetical protein WA158_000812 [Blastocystis sp. Blastoise]
MSATEFQLSEDKYLFTFQDETQLWVSKEFIEKYPQFPFHGIVEHSEKYEDGSYYMDITSFPMNKVIDFLMDDNVDVFSLNLKESYDIYITLVEYSVTIDKKIQSDLLFHIKNLFYKYLKDNNYDVYGYHCNYIESCMPMDLFNIVKKDIYFYDLFTPQRKDELLYYSLLFKMMNITKVRIIYDYASNIPLEYINPSCIQDIFPSLKKVEMAVTTHYKKTDVLLNPNSDEYIMEYNRLFNRYDYEIENPEEYEYYSESEMNEYYKISSLDLNKLYYLHDLIDSYNKRREKNNLPKLYRYVVNEAIYTDDYSSVETNEEEDEYTLDDEVRIEYDYKTNDKTFSIYQVSTEHGISQLLLLPSYMCTSKIILIKDLYHQINPMFFMKLFEEGVFDSITTLSINWIKRLTNKIDENLFNKIMTTHIFLNVTELIYDYDNATDNFDSLFPVNLMSMIDIIRINYVDSDEKEEICLLLDEIAYTHSIHIDALNDFIYYFPHLKELLEKDLISIDQLKFYSTRSENIKRLDSIDNYKHSINSLAIWFYGDDDDDDDDDHDDDDDNNNDDDDEEDDDDDDDDDDDNNNDDDDDEEDDDDDNDDDDDDNDDNDDDNDNNNNNNNNRDETDIRNSLETFFKSSVLEHLNYLYVSFSYGLSIEYLTWISTLFNDNKFNTIHKLKISLLINEDSSSEYLTVYENIINKLIPKASIVNIEECTMSFINRLIPTGCFHKTTQLILRINDMPNDIFCKLYTTDNFPQLKSIKIYEDSNKWWIPFIKTFCNYINNNNFPSSKSEDDYVYDPNNSIFRYKYDSHSFIDSIICTKNETMSRYEIETLFDCINENKTQNIRSLELYFYISDIKNNVFKQQLKDSTFIQENHVYYKFDINNLSYL